MTDNGELDIVPAVKGSLAEFFARILSMEVDLFEGGPSMLMEGSGFRGRIEISGEKQGRADILVADDYAVLMAASMLGASVEEVEIDHEVPDLLLEMADFISKKLARCLEDAGFSCTFSDPGVQAEKAFEERSQPDGKPVRIAFKHQEYIGLLEIFLQDAESRPDSGEPENIAAEKQLDNTVSNAAPVSDGPEENLPAGDAPPDADDRSDTASEPAPRVNDTKPPGKSTDNTGDALSTELELEPLDDGDLHALLDTPVPSSDGKPENPPDVPTLSNDGAPSDAAKQPATGVQPGEGAIGGQKPTLPDETPFQPAKEKGDTPDDPDTEDFEGLSAEDLADLTTAPADDAEPQSSDGDEAVPPEEKAAADEPKGQVHKRKESHQRDAGSGLPSGKLSPAGKTRKGLRRVAVLVCTLLLTAVAGGTFYFWHRPKRQAPAARLTAKRPVPVTQAVTMRVAPPKTKEPGPAPAPDKPEALTPQAMLERRLAEAQQLREKILAKQDDILSLVQYFKNAVEHQCDRIRQQLQKSRIHSFQKAIGNEELALALRTIQRQSISLEVLQKPLEWLGSASEALDYGIRKTRIDFQMAPYTRGTDLQRLARSVEELIQKYTIDDEHLLKNVQQSDPVPVKAIWKDIATGIKKTVWVQGTSASPNTGLQVNLGQWLVNRKIWRQLCRGDYHRKSDLTMISAQAAACLTKDRVKDLFLDGLEELPAAAAYHLARWPGDWLALNGLTRLSAAAAQQLAKWKGQRLSLNSLETLSPQAAGFLSHWPGRQLELVSLSVESHGDARRVTEALKNWMGPGKKLFISRKMRRMFAAAGR